MHIVYACTNTRKHARTDIQTHTHIFTYTHTHTHTHTVHHKIVYTYKERHTHKPKVCLSRCLRHTDSSSLHKNTEKQTLVLLHNLSFNTNA